MLHKWRWKCNFKIPWSALRSNALRSCSTLKIPPYSIFKNYSISQAPEGGVIFNGMTKDRNKARFHHNDFPMLVKERKCNVCVCVHPFTTSRDSKLRPVDVVQPNHKGQSANDRKLSSEMFKTICQKTLSRKHNHRVFVHVVTRNHVCQGQHVTARIVKKSSSRK